MPPPVTLSVSLSNPTITLSPGNSVSVPVVVVAPTETVTFAIDGLPAGVAESYKESESNPSGLLTLTAGASAKPGTYQPTIIVGSSGQTASFAFTLVVVTMSGGVEGPALRRACFVPEKRQFIRLIIHKLGKRDA